MTGKDAYLTTTDSGSIQEDAPKHVKQFRDKLEHCYNVIIYHVP